MKENMEKALAREQRLEVIEATSDNLKHNAANFRFVFVSQSDVIVF